MTVVVDGVQERGLRREHDLLGEMNVPQDAYYGIHTARARENFPISGSTVATMPELIRAVAATKQAAAIVNRELGLLDPAIAGAIVSACAEIRDGELHDHFCVDVMQGGAGTSTNMAANEVIANRALELLGRPRGEYRIVSPLDHVNCGQSTNDVYPTAVRIAVHELLQGLIAQVRGLRLVVSERAEAFEGLTKLGRTQLQDAVPMTLGQEFSAWASTLQEEELRLADVSKLLCEVNLGGTAIGTSVNTHPDFPRAAVDQLAELTGLPLILAPDLIEATSDTGVFVTVSSTVKRTALKVSKVCNDLRLLASGPTTGFGEINLPPMQSGSSIMPGKVNPVIAEAVNQIAFDVLGSDLTVTMAANAGQLQLNAFEPVIAVALFRSIRQLTVGCTLLADRCIASITPNVETLARNSVSDTGVLTALASRLGYEAATAMAASAAREGRTIGDVLVARGVMTRQELSQMLDGHTTRVSGEALRTADGGLS